MNFERKRHTISVAVALLVIVILGCWWFIEARRFYIVSGKNGIAYKVDRRTGKTWLIRGTSITEVKEPEPERDLVKLSDDDMMVLEGRAGYRVGSLFGGTIYNPTEFYIYRVEVAVIVSAEGEEEREREFSDEVFIAPKSTGEFQFDTLDGAKTGKTHWRMVSAYGYKPR